MSSRNEGMVKVDINIEKSDLQDELDLSNLAYPRRTHRAIGNEKFDLTEPSIVASATMQKIKSSGTLIEKLFEVALQDSGILFCKSDQLVDPVPGKPNFILPKFKVAIFCDGDFWHGYDLAKQKFKNNREFWKAKIDRNIARDAEVRTALHESGWKVFRFWEHEIKANAEICINKIRDFISKIPSESSKQFTFVDLFSGVGGFRIPLEELGGKCLAFAEIDKPASDVYKLNFLGFTQSDELELGSVRDVGKLPFDEIDLIVGGVPCQSWSVAGKMKGFDDPRGQLWFDTLRIVESNLPKAFIFENVKGLLEPRNRANLNLIVSGFEKLGYYVRYDLMNSYDFGLPQNRDRIFIVGIRQDLPVSNAFRFPGPLDKNSFLSDIIEGVEVGNTADKPRFDKRDLFGTKVPMSRNRFQKLDELNDFFVFCDTRNGHSTIHSWDIVRTSRLEKEICLSILSNRRKKKYGAQDGNPLSFVALKELLPQIKQSDLDGLIAKKILRLVKGKGYEFVNSKNSSGINGIYRIYLPHSNIFSTLTATGTRDMVALRSIDASTPEEYRKKFLSEIMKPKAFRKISSKEAAKLQGFPPTFAIHKDDKLAQKQFGNAVSTCVVFHVAKSLLDSLEFCSEKASISDLKRLS